ncbi:hypothetical protein E2C01_065183 [Portunus trituberculatus]|uniref:Uncharacterized protein n=1 Tax=Portunus trituberculatus TaxID=210409 RepID=A0A5B7HEZ4_PORTR|nr:hypothetical protein [Portunus trituberculatus]
MTPSLPPPFPSPRLSCPVLCPGFPSLAKASPAQPSPASPQPAPQCRHLALTGPAVGVCHSPFIPGPSDWHCPPLDPGRDNNPPSLGPASHQAALQAQHSSGASSRRHRSEHRSVTTHERRYLSGTPPRLPTTPRTGSCPAAPRPAPRGSPHCLSLLRLIGARAVSRAAAAEARRRAGVLPPRCYRHVLTAPPPLHPPPPPTPRPH